MDLSTRSSKPCFRILIRKYNGFHLGHCAQLFFLQRLCEEYNASGLIIVSSNIPIELKPQMIQELKFLELNLISVYWLTERETLYQADQKFGTSLEIVHQLFENNLGFKSASSNSSNLRKIEFKSGVITDFRCSYRSLLEGHSLLDWPLILSNPKLSSVWGMFHRKIPVDSIRQFCLDIEKNSSLSSNWLFQLTYKYYMSQNLMHLQNIVDPIRFEIMGRYPDHLEYFLWWGGRLVVLSNQVWLSKHDIKHIPIGGIFKLAKTPYYFKLIDYSKLEIVAACFTSIRELIWISSSTISQPVEVIFSMFPNHYQLSQPYHPSDIDPIFMSGIAEPEVTRDAIWCLTGLGIFHKVPSDKIILSQICYSQ